MQCAEMQNLLAFNAMVALRIIRCTVHEDGSNSAKLKVFHLYCTAMTRLPKGRPRGVLDYLELANPS